MNPRYPIYIVSKGRWKNALTPRALDEMGVAYTLVVESHELDKYRSKMPLTKYLVLPKRYQDEYNTLDDVGDEKSKGPGPARNFCLDHAKDRGYKRHWVMDDNLDAFHYMNKYEKYEVRTGATLAAMEDFVDRYNNVPVAGPNYYSFAKKTDALKPFVLNTRIYSCLLIDNWIQHRWRGRYNEDTILSIDVLKSGLCTIQFNAFLCGKVTTQRMKGGNTEEFYESEGTLPKSQMLADTHPDVAEVVWRFNRWHHHVKYKAFRNNKLIKIDRKDYPKVNNYGMVAKMVDKEGNPISCRGRENA